MKAPVVFLISLTVAILSLREWPDGTVVWMRALTALAAMTIGIAAIVLSAPSSAAPRFQIARKPPSLGRVASAALAVMILGLLYLILVVAPPTARQFSELIHAAIAGGPGQLRESPDDVETIWTDEQAFDDFEIGTSYDPDGALVPKSARLTASDEAQVSLKTASRAKSAQLRGAGEVYLHSFSHHAFDGERWTTRNPAGPQKLTQGTNGLIHLWDSSQAPAYRYVIVQHGKEAGGSTMSTLQGVHFVRLPEITQVSPGTWLLPAKANRSDRAYDYDAGSSPKTFVNLMASATSIEAGDAGALYLTPTSDTSLRLLVKKLAGRFQNAAPLEKRLADLQAWLSDTYTYSRIVDFSEDASSPIESFLAHPETNRGFCVHFASAAVLLLRELGVPARISYGWTGGQYYEDYNQFVFRGEHAHAWAEIYLKGHGWVVFETTPASGLPQSNAAPEGELPPDADEPDAQEEKQEVEAPPAFWWKWLLVAPLVAAALLCVLMIMQRGKRAAGGAEQKAELVHAPPGYLVLFDEACRSMGHPKPIGCTLLQYLDHLDTLEVHLPFGEELLHYHYDVIYREVPRDPQFEQRLCSQIKAL